MRVIDARSGEEIQKGSRVRYGNGEGYDVRDLHVGMFSAYADVTTHDVDYTTGSMVHTDQRVAMPVRYLHPAFPFQKVAFYPS